MKNQEEPFTENSAIKAAIDRHHENTADKKVVNSMNPGLVLTAFTGIGSSVLYVDTDPTRLEYANRIYLAKTIDATKLHGISIARRDVVLAVLTKDWDPLVLKEYKNWGKTVCLIDLIDSEDE